MIKSKTIGMMVSTIKEIIKSWDRVTSGGTGDVSGKLLMEEGRAR